MKESVATTIPKSTGKAVEFQGAPLRESAELDDLCRKVEAVANMLSEFANHAEGADPARVSMVMDGCAEALHLALEDVTRFPIDLERGVYKLMPQHPHAEAARLALYPLLCHDWQPTVDESENVEDVPVGQFRAV